MQLTEDIKKIERFFNARYNIYLDMEQKDYGWCNGNTIAIRSDLSHTEKILTIIHEFVHLAWKIDHGYFARKIGFNSNGNDYFSQALYEAIFPRRRMSRAKNACRKGARRGL